MNKYAVNAILCYIKSVESHPLLWLVSLKASLLPGVYAIIDTITPSQLQQVHALSSPAGRMLFKSTYEDYKRTHKYTGEA